MADSPDNTQDKVFEMLSDQKKAIEKKLFRNLLYQSVCIILGFSYVFQFSNKIGPWINDNLKIDIGLIQAIIPVALLLLFIELGYALGQFFHISTVYRKMTSQLIDKFTNTNPFGNSGETQKINYTEDLKLSFVSFTIFDQLSVKPLRREGKVQFSIASIFLLLIFLSNHFIMFQMCDYEITNKWMRLFFKLLASTILFYFYFQFNTSESLKRHTPNPATKIISTVSIILITFYLLNEIFPELKLRET